MAETTETTFTLRVPEDLKNRFTARAQAQDLSGSQVLREFMRRFAESGTPAYDAWFTAKVRAAQEDPRPSVPDSEVQRHFAQLRARAAQRVTPSKRKPARKR